MLKSQVPTSPHNPGSSAPMPKLYEALAEAFLAEGVDTQFVLMGDGNMHWSTAFAKLPGVHTVHVRHEHCTVAAATAYNVATGKVAVASVTCGPGVTQVMTALPAAVRARLPMVVFAGESPINAKFYNQYIDQAPLVTATGALGSSPCLAAFLPRGGSVGHRVGFDPGHEMVALLEQAVRHLAGGVVGIGDKVEGSLDSQDIEQAEHLVEQGALVAIGPYQTFVDAHGERHGEDALGRVYEQADSLHGMPHDVLGLGVGFRLLMQELYGRHFLAALGGFDAVPDQDQPAIDRYEAWEQLQHSLRPQGRKPVELDAAAVKVIQQLGVEPGPQ